MKRLLFLIAMIGMIAACNPSDGGSDGSGVPNASQEPTGTDDVLMPSASPADSMEASPSAS